MWLLNSLKTMTRTKLSLPSSSGSRLYKDSFRVTKEIMRRPFYIENKFILSRLVTQRCTLLNDQGGKIILFD